MFFPQGGGDQTVPALWKAFIILSMHQEYQTLIAEAHTKNATEKCWYTNYDNFNNGVEIRMSEFILPLKTQKKSSIIQHTQQFIIQINIYMLLRMSVYSKNVCR